MDKLHKVWVSVVAVLAAAIIPVACSEDEESETKEVFDIRGKVFVHAYSNDTLGIHEYGTEILEFGTNDTVVQYNLFCFLAGDYFNLYDYEEKGRYAVIDNKVTVGLGDSLQTGTIVEAEKKLLRMPNVGLYDLSELSVAGVKKQFERLHTHEIVDPVVKPGLQTMAMEVDTRYFISLDDRSFILNVDSVSGSHAGNNQEIKFTISGTPGEFVMSETKGLIYLMRFGKMAYAPVDKELAEESPEDVVLVLSTDNTTPDCSLISPSLDNSFKGKKLNSMIIKLNPKSY